MKYLKMCLIGKLASKDQEIYNIISSKYYRNIIEYILAFEKNGLIFATNCVPCVYVE